MLMTSHVLGNKKPKDLPAKLACLFLENADLVPYSPLVTAEG